jgi:hypothetical protein
MPMADSVLSTPPLTYEAVATTSAPGALSLCRPLVIRDSRPNASQASGAEANYLPSERIVQAGREPQ